jgi:WD repeat-containing protein 26
VYDAEKQLLPRIGFGRLQQNASRDLHEDESPSFWLTCDKSSMSKSEIARHRWHEAARRINEMRPARIEDVILGIAEIPNYVQKLKRMSITCELEEDRAHRALVRCLDFSPDGQSLVTSRSVIALLTFDFSLMH